MEYYKNRGGEVVFSGDFNGKLNDYTGGKVIDITIEDGIVKVKFLNEDESIGNNQVDIKDALRDNFSFYCR